ncbi:PREDICTED: stimulated by retinoic acid gene 8 protein homolog [Chinchilla lanigera]|uniref:Stimulated by retinoic acid 8 n=1 Tax=Chinchilla lanigera TaxID=34839 RepID=A0A8C2YJ84_CHILA|nr:PREDICTED: stimulated by retinoic acid gene 8 protein homolog [Chinchilla lanigera]XP_005405547.1 PREDICTED: stimulated by retinoic acid gene 8 protein homolog [Chinchilla lanigera]XP_005405548.1 PREDICTED: stimulated by retinoic acid gene 8 protein homolog [Chinchilla lanigera]XP_005405549.1 PREDICTED: stimulated by retinoic acid gene 8 protein homolog [Chinchilla lanigera]
MATAGEGSHPVSTVPQPLMQVQELEPRVARRRLSQARHRATMAGLFDSLRKTVFTESELTASKWQVLNKAKNHIRELEETLDSLLKLKGSFNLEDGNPCSLEEVKEEYAGMFSRNESLISESFLQNGSFPWFPTEAVEKDLEGDEGEEEEEENQEEAEAEAEAEEEEEKKVDLLHSPITSPPDLLEFERYLTFYKQTMDLLIGNGVVSSQEALQPVVSAAVSHLWQTLSEDGKTSVLQIWAQYHGDLQSLGTCPQLAYAEDSVKDSGVDSQGASCSLVSTPEDVILEDVFDVASFFDKSEFLSASNLSSGFASFNQENSEKKLQLYQQIMEFLKGLCSISYVNNQLKQEEPAPPADDEMLMLRCLETFDDEDL